MNIEVYKYLIYGKRSEMDRFFSYAQKGGFIQFIGVSHKKALELPEEAKTILAAMKIAKRHIVHKEKAPRIEPLALAKKILSLQAKEEALKEELRILTAEISRIAPFGNFSKEDLEAIERDGKRIVQFFCRKSDLKEELPSEVIYVGTEYDLDYFIAIHKTQVQYPKMIEIQIEQPVGILRERLARAREELSLTEAALRSSCNGFFDLQDGLNDCLNEYNLSLVKHDTSMPLGNALFAIEAWVPKTRVKALNSLLSGLDVEVEQIAIESSDRIPTYLENCGISKIGEDLIEVYDTPAHTDKDPSRWVLFFFTLFFAMIVSDAGYGVLFLIAALWIQWKLPSHATGAAKRFVKLFMILALASIAWGVATASFFGIEIGLDSPFRKTSFIHYLASRKAEYHMREKDDVYEAYAKRFPAVVTAKNGHDFLVATSYEKEGSTKYLAQEKFYDNIFLEFSLVIGIIHLTLSFMRWIFRNPGGLGWILFMLGGYLYFPVYLGATTIVNFMGWVPKPIAAKVGLQLLAIGPTLVVIIALFQKKKWGSIFKLMDGIGVFSDILSYLRLYALALAGMVLAGTVNTTLGIDAGIIGTVLIILLGHSINITLSMMGASIHGLRLNFLEWYRYSFEGGGRPFNPLRLRKSK